MDDDNFSPAGRSKTFHGRDIPRDPRKEGYREQDFKDRNLRYNGPPERFAQEHARRYGPQGLNEEEFRKDNSHVSNNPRFPPNTEREREYNKYDQWTQKLNDRATEYRTARGTAAGEVGAMSDDEEQYYVDNTKGLTPTHHASLQPRADAAARAAFKNATGRENLLSKFEYGYHTVESQNEHVDHTENAYHNYETATRNWNEHEINRRLPHYPNPSSSSNRGMSTSGYTSTPSGRGNRQGMNDCPPLPSSSRGMGAFVNPPIRTNQRGLDNRPPLQPSNRGMSPSGNPPPRGSQSGTNVRAPPTSFNRGMGDFPALPESSTHGPSRDPSASGNQRSSGSATQRNPWVDGSPHRGDSGNHGGSRSIRPLQPGRGGRSGGGRNAGSNRPGDSSSRSGWNGHGSGSHDSHGQRW